MVKIVFVTCPPERASEIAGHLLNQRVCACVNVVPEVESRYWWQGRLESARESLLIIKCDAELLDTVVEKVKEVHPYEVPEVTALTVEGGNPDYLEWVRNAPRGEPAPASAAAPAEEEAAALQSEDATTSLPASTGTAEDLLASLPPPDESARARIGRMKIVMLGPPGVGKGTQSRLMAARYGLQYVSSGDLLLKEIRGGTEMGRRIEQYTRVGKLVPDGEATLMLRKHIGEIRESGYVLEGYPRTVTQAQALAETERINVVFYINAPQEVLIARLTKRFYCDCGETYGPGRMPAIPGLCDGCGGMLYQREDDQPRHVLTRLEEYNAKTRELLRYYRDKLRPVDGSASVPEVFRQLCRHLER